jgi:membrane protease subunit HflK
LQAVLGALAASWLLQGLYRVDHAETAAVLRLGRLIDDAVGPGLHWAAPSPFDQVRKERTSEVLRLELAGDYGEPLDFLTADENLIETKAVVQYRVVRLGPSLFGVETVDQLLSQSVRAALVEELATRKVDDVLTTAKAEVQNRVRQEVQASLDRYGSGLVVVNVSLQATAAPVEAASAFRAVLDARAESAQAVDKAHSEGERALSLARAEAQRRVELADSSARARLELAKGQSERFQQILRERLRAKKQVETDLHLRTVGQVLARAKLVILAPGQSPRIDLHWRSGLPNQEQP